MATAFNNKTISEIKDLIINSFQENFNKTFRILPKSFIKVIAAVFAGVYVTLYKQIGWLFLQIFPETAYWGEVIILGTKVRPLIKWGILTGVGEPRNGSQWKGNILISVTHAGAPLIAGTQLKSDTTGKLYITEESITLENSTETIPIICADSGTAGNLEVDDVLSFVSPLGIVQRAVTVTGVTSYAIENETETEYRARVVNRFRSPPLGGALADYRRWSSDVIGVLNTYPYKDIETPSGVLLYIAGVPSLFPDRIPTVDLLRQVGHACTYDPETGKATRKPITAVIDPDYNEGYKNVKAVSVTAFDVYIDGIIGAPVSDFGSAAHPAVSDYFFGREPYIRGLSDDNNKTNIISKNNITTVIDQIAISLKVEFGSIKIMRNGILVETYTLGVGELSKLYRLFLNGGLYE